ncbi:MAG: hypothetical protein ACE148_16960 [Vicinamibacterales bacterium]
MTWILYRWTWRVASPLFIGTTPSGALNRCRVYVPTRPLWGAITAELARLEGDKDPQYRQVGEVLREQARFSYLYPAERAGDDWRAWIPEYREGAGLVWAREDSDVAVAGRRFCRALLWTRPGTAIDPDNDSALDGSLRETECVQTHWRHGDGSHGSAVGLVGYVFLRDGADVGDRLSTLGTLFIGGDTRYGLGRLERVAMAPANTFFGATVALHLVEPHVLAHRALGHALVDNRAPMCGEQEAIGGWDMTGHEQGPRISGPVWTPGSRVLAADAPPRFQIDEHGLWQLREDYPSESLSNGASSS